MFVTIISDFTDSHLIFRGLEKVKDKAIGRLTDGISVPFTTRSYNMALNKQLELETIAKATAVASFYLQTFYQVSSLITIPSVSIHLCLLSLLFSVPTSLLFLTYQVRHILF